MAQSIRARPKCRLLVFGAGNDSPIWLSLNALGETVFLEDDETWIAEARRRSPRADVVAVRYRTRLARWREELDQPQILELALPDRVASSRWDVIVVDGPRGYPGDSEHPMPADRPGRGSSISSAARLIAPGGDVFVHDCERACEAAYAAKYLRTLSVVQDVCGRALLRQFRNG